MYRTLVLILSSVPLALANDNWENFTNNLATDLAPLIVLFGEGLTKQFLSESISLLDNIIFALSPLGILTTVVSVIRVCGGSSLRAFIGRAQEGPAEAESELLPCVSDSTAELFNDRGISRVFGRPRILEIVAWENEDPKTGRRSREIGTLLDAITNGVWSVKGTGRSPEDWACLDEVSIPNLSLNKGIKSRGRFWFICAAVLGSFLQIGVIIYAAVTVFLYPEAFKKNGQPVPSYAFPFFVAGSTLLFTGMFFSAVIIERSSKEYFIKPKKPSKIYWLQPGNQNVGDQVFSAFLAVKEAPDSKMTTNLRYIKSIRDHRFDGQHFKIYLTVFSTMLGFVIQFIGLRGLHASVILASVGATFLMSVVRTCLRTERMTPDENYLKEDRKLTSHKQQELDFFAFHLERIKSFSLLCSSPLDGHLDHISSSSSEESPECLIDRVIQTRARLAELTSRPGCGRNIPWDSIPIRTAAHNLAKTIEDTTDLLSTWTAGFDKTFDFRLALECHFTSPQFTLPVRGTYSINLQRCGDALKWRVNVYELEAILGLWTWSLYQLDEEWYHPLYRMIGLSAAEASREETYLYFHKWVFRQTEAKMVSADMIDASRRRFGFDSERYAFDRDILVVQTENALEMMAAQDIYVEFLRHAVRQIGALGGEVDVTPGLQNTYLVRSTRIDEMVRCFEGAGLGSREDALLCIVPVLKDQDLLPELAGDTAIVRKRIEDSIQQEDWKSAFALLHWICERSEGSEFERTVYELGYLCRRGLLANEGALGNGPSESLKYIRRIVSSNIRKDFRKAQRMSPPSNWSESSDLRDWWRSFASQLFWLVSDIPVEVPGMDDLKRSIQQSSRDIGGISLLEEDLRDTTGTTNAQAMREWLTKDEIDVDEEYFGLDEDLGYQWALDRGLHALLYFSLVRWAEVGANCPPLIVLAYTAAARNRFDWGIRVLKRHDADIDTMGGNNISALVERTAAGDVGAVQTLLEHGANPDGNSKDLRPLIIAADEGFTDIVGLLLQHGAALEILDEDGQSALYWACRAERIDTVRFLLDKGIDIDRIGKDRKTVLHSAVTQNQVGMVELLLERGADINLHERHLGQTALMLAAENSHADLLRLLIAKSAKLDAQDFEGRTALDWAKRRESQAAVSILEESLKSPKCYHVN